MNSNRPLQVFLAIVLGGTLVIGSMWLFFFWREIQKSTLPVYGEVPDFALIERSGRTVKRQELLGNVWIADFIFTNCGSACPMMSANMKQLQNVLNDSADVKLVSITVDPVRDTPAVLSEYAKRYGARTDQWLFLTGDPAAIQKLAKEGFFLSAEAGTDPKDPIIHSQKFALVDKKGRLRGFFDGESPALTRTLLNAIDSLEKERY